jgi:hypothetical protein
MHYNLKKKKAIKIRKPQTRRKEEDQRDSLSVSSSCVPHPVKL